MALVIQSCFQRAAPAFIGMPIRQSSVVTGDQVRQYPTMQPELGFRVLCPSSRVINSTRQTFKVGIIAGHRFDTLLKCRAVLPQVVP